MQVLSWNWYGLHFILLSEIHLKVSTLGLGVYIIHSVRVLWFWRHFLMCQVVLLISYMIYTPV